MRAPMVTQLLGTDELNTVAVNLYDHPFPCGYLAVVRMGGVNLQTHNDATAEDLASRLEQVALELRHLAAEFRGEPLQAAA